MTREKVVEPTTGELSRMTLKAKSRIIKMTLLTGLVNSLILLKRPLKMEMLTMTKVRRDQRPSLSLLS